MRRLGCSTPTPSPSLARWSLNDVVPLTGQLARQGGAYGTWPGLVPSLMLPFHLSSWESGNLEPRSLIFIFPHFHVFLCSLQTSPCCFSCHFIHPASFFLSLFSPIAFSPFYLCFFLSFYFILPFLIYFSFSFLFVLVASRRGFLNSLSFSAFSTRRIYFVFSF